MSLGYCDTLMSRVQQWHIQTFLSELLTHLLGHHFSHVNNLLCLASLVFTQWAWPRWALQLVSNHKVCLSFLWTCSGQWPLSSVLLSSLYSLWSSGISLAALWLVPCLQPAQSLTHLCDLLGTSFDVSSEPLSCVGVPIHWNFQVSQQS